MSASQIASSLRRNPLMPLLVIVQVAIACAILCNAFFLLSERLTPMLVPSGIAAGQIIEVDEIVASGRLWTGADIEAGTQALRNIPGVEKVAPAMGIPLSSSMRGSAQLQAADGPKVSVDVFMGQNMLDALGLQLAEGRDFQPSDYRDFDVRNSNGHTLQSIIITQALAAKLFTSGHALGQSLRNPDSKDGRSYHVVGIVRHLLRYQLDNATNGRAEYAILLPVHIVGTPILGYVIRAQAAQRSRVLKAVPDALAKAFGSALMPGISISANTFESLRDSVFSSWRAAVWLLGTVCLVVAVVTAIGIMGLMGYWVQQRTRQVGIRRALGARRRDILGYFLAENMLIIGFGVLLGMLAAFAINLYLVRHYELGRLPWIYLPVGAVTLWLMGQLAVLGPALFAAAVPPAVATRSV
ncbi:MAG TPA: FtsX-like permease family protein [Steroidobacteraceae bacterium]